MSDLLERTYNPDVLTCLANLSNDEVFTPPELANDMLDMLPEELWQDPNARILYFRISRSESTTLCTSNSLESPSRR